MEIPRVSASTLFLSWILFPAIISRPAHAVSNSNSSVLPAEVGVFILATARWKTTSTSDKQKKKVYYNFFSNRIVPAAQTWGRSFPRLYFVFGRNAEDLEFLQQNCKEHLRREYVEEGRYLDGTWDTDRGMPWRRDRRELSVKMPQADPFEAIVEYECSSDVTHSMEGPQDKYATPTHGRGRPTGSMMMPKANPDVDTRATAVRILYTANCTGEYYGEGPTCRCQEAMRYALAIQAYKIKGSTVGPQLKWFIFGDDDVYFSPQATLALLASYDETAPIVFVGNSGPRGFKNTFNRSDPCSNPCVHRWIWAQPAIISIAALESVRGAMSERGLVEEQHAIHGTHDFVLGALLWMYAVPFLSLKMRNGDNGIYRGSPVRSEEDLGKNVIFHHVRAENPAEHGENAYDLFAMLHDNGISPGSTLEEKEAAEMEQRKKLGFSKYFHDKHPVPEQQDGFQYTRHARTFNYTAGFKPYLRSDCADYTLPAGYADVSRINRTSGKEERVCVVTSHTQSRRRRTQVVSHESESREEQFHPGTMRAYQVLIPIQSRERK